MTHKERVLAFVRTNPGCSDADIANALGISHQQANNRARQLVREGKIRRNPPRPAANFPA